MKTLNNLVLYLRHISFIEFMICVVILYSAFFEFDLGIPCLIISFLYIIMNILLFFIKNNREQNNAFNNFVLIFLHFYVGIVAYRYLVISNAAIMSNSSYFTFNFFMISLCLCILSINKIIICNMKWDYMSCFFVISFSLLFLSFII